MNTYPTLSRSPSTIPLELLNAEYGASIKTEHAFNGLGVLDKVKYFCLITVCQAWWEQYCPVPCDEGSSFLMPISERQATRYLKLALTAQGCRSRKADIHPDRLFCIAGFLVLTFVLHNSQAGSSLRSWTGVDGDIALLPKGDPPNPSTGAIEAFIENGRINC